MNYYDKYGIEVNKDESIVSEAKRIYKEHGFQGVLDHVESVNQFALVLAEEYGVSKSKVELAAILHDISVIVPNEEKIELCETLNIEVLEEERIFPLVIHQKLSAHMAKHLFGVEDESIISAIGCHTTLKANAGMIDKIVFISDKLEWDQEGIAPYDKSVRHALAANLDSAVRVFLDYMMDNKDDLRVLHPWLVEAQVFMNNNRGTNGK